MVLDQQQAQNMSESNQDIAQCNNLAAFILWVGRNTPEDDDLKLEIDAVRKVLDFEDDDDNRTTTRQSVFTITKQWCLQLPLTAKQQVLYVKVLKDDTKKSFARYRKLFLWLNLMYLILQVLVYHAEQTLRMTFSDHKKLSTQFGQRLNVSSLCQYLRRVGIPFECDAFLSPKDVLHPEKELLEDFATWINKLDLTRVFAALDSVE
jgi:hypothetical protein